MADYAVTSAPPPTLPVVLAIYEALGTEPTEMQRAYHEGRAYFGGRRNGKTYAAVVQALAGALLDAPTVVRLFSDDARSGLHAFDMARGIATTMAASPWGAGAGIEVEARRINGGLRLVVAVAGRQAEILFGPEDGRDARRARDRCPYPAMVWNW